MPKYYCDYCDTYLTHDSPSVRKTHCQGRKHKDNVKYFYQKWMEEQAQHLIDATTAAFKAGKIASNPFAANKGAAIAPPPNLGPRPGVPPQGPLGMMPPPGMHPGGPMGPGGPMMMGPHGPMPPMMGMRPPMMGPMGTMMGPMGPMGPMRPPMNGPPPSMPGPQPIKK